MIGAGEAVSAKILPIFSEFQFDQRPVLSVLLATMIEKKIKASGHRPDAPLDPR
jgi:hypothetical protein